MPFAQRQSTYVILSIPLICSAFLGNTHLYSLVSLTISTLSNHAIQYLFCFVSTCTQYLETPRLHKKYEVFKTLCQRAGFELAAPPCLCWYKAAGARLPAEPSANLRWMVGVCHGIFLGEHLLLHHFLTDTYTE